MEQRCRGAWYACCTYYLASHCSDCADSSATLAVQVIAIVRKHKSAQQGCVALINEATQRWRKEEGSYRDDITAIVVHLPLALQAAAWQSHGSRMAVAWQPHGSRMRHGRGMAGAWQRNEAWQVHGRCMAEAWQVHGSRFYLYLPTFVHQYSVYLLP